MTTDMDGIRERLASPFKTNTIKTCGTFLDRNKRNLSVQALGCWIAFCGIFLGSLNLVMQNIKVPTINPDN